MKLAWLCYKLVLHTDDDFPTFEKPVIVFEQPDDYEWHKIVPIVYAEIVE